MSRPSSLYNLRNNIINLSTLHPRRMYHWNLQSTRLAKDDTLSEFVLFGSCTVFKAYSSQSTLSNSLFPVATVLAFHAVSLFPHSAHVFCVLFSAHVRYGEGLCASFSVRRCAYSNVCRLVSGRRRIRIPYLVNVIVFCRGEECCSTT